MEFAIGRGHRAATLYPVGLPVQPDHDAAMRISGEAPDGEPILYRGNESQYKPRDLATSDRLVGPS